MTDYSKSGAGDGSARSESRQAANEVREGAKDVANQGKDRARSFLDEQKETAAERAHGFADALRDTARDLEQRGQPSSTSHFAERAAEGIDRLADTLRDKNVDGILREAQRFARRSPALFVGGSVVAGVLLGRFMRSSRPTEGDDSNGTSHARHGNGGSRVSGDTFASGTAYDPVRQRSEGGVQSNPSSPSTIQRSQGGTPPSGGQR